MRRLFLFAFAAAALLCATAAWAQLPFNGGRCDGTISMIAGDQTFFTAGTNPAPESLWILVLSGGGNVQMAASGGGVSSGLYFHAGDLLFFSSGGPYQLDFQGGSMLIAYGGTITGSSGDPICGTGSLGPVILLADAGYAVKMQSAHSGLSVQVGAYTTVASKWSGNLPYTLATGLASKGTYSVPTCSGSSCCNPQQAVFPVSNSGSALFTVYQVTSSLSADFDYLLVASTQLTATAQASPTAGAAPLSVSFTGSALGGTPPYTWDWDFGDGSGHSSSQNPVHTYTAQGVYHPVLKVKDTSGQTATDSHLSVDSTSFTATATATPATGDAPLTVAFKGTAAGGKAPYTYSWDFGDGGASSDQNPAHTYAAEGTYKPVLTAVDASAKTATDDHLSIKVSPPGALVAVANADRTSGPYPLAVSFTGAGGGGFPPYTYSWNFGDGQQSAAQNVAHTYAQEGTFTAALTVTDTKATSATDDHLRIYVGSDFVVTASATPKAGLPPLTVHFSCQVTGGTPPLTYAWRFGDGTPDSSEQSPTHVYESNGAFQVYLSVSDAAGHFATDSSLAIQVGPGGNTPVVTSVVKATDPFRLKIGGLNFLVGCTIQLDGKPAPQTGYKSAAQVVAKGGDALKAMVPKGVSVCVTVRNPDGSTSDCYTYVR